MKKIFVILTGVFISCNSIDNDLNTVINIYDGYLDKGFSQTSQYVRGNSWWKFDGNDLQIEYTAVVNKDLGDVLDNSGNLYRETEKYPLTNLEENFEYDELHQEVRKYISGKWGGHDFNCQILPSEDSESGYRILFQVFYDNDTYHTWGEYLNRTQFDKIKNIFQVDITSNKGKEVFQEYLSVQETILESQKITLGNSIMSKIYPLRNSYNNILPEKIISDFTDYEKYWNEEFPYSGLPNLAYIDWRYLDYYYDELPPSISQEEVIFLVDEEEFTQNEFREYIQKEIVDRLSNLDTISKSEFGFLTGIPMESEDFKSKIFKSLSFYIGLEWDESNTSQYIYPPMIDISTSQEYSYNGTIQDSGENIYYNSQSLRQLIEEKLFTDYLDNLKDSFRIEEDVSVIDPFHYFDLNFEEKFGVILEQMFVLISENNSYSGIDSYYLRYDGQYVNSSGEINSGYVRLNNSRLKHLGWSILGSYFLGDIIQNNLKSIKVSGEPLKDKVYYFNLNETRFKDLPYKEFYTISPDENFTKEWR